MTVTNDVKMFDGKDLAGLSGPNGISQPDASDFAFLAGSTAAAGWLATDRNGGGNRLERFKDRTATGLEGAAERATEARTAAQSEAAAARSAATAAGDASATATAEARAATKATEAAAKKVGGDAAIKAGAKAATEAAEAAVKAASKKGAAEAAAKLAVRKGAVLAARQLGTRAAAFAIGTAIPGPGWLVAAGVLIGSLIFDKDLRNMVTGAFSSGMDINQRPAPPTTNWLPSTDDNRQNDIRPADARLTQLNNAVTGISPDTYKLWHLQESEVPGLTTMEEPLKSLDAAGTAITNLSNDYITALNSAPRMWGDSMREGRIGVAANLGKFKELAGNPVGEALSAAASHSNTVYQGIREGNARAREQLSRSRGRFLGFVGGGSGADGLIKNLDGIESSNADLKRAEEQLNTAGADWMVKPVDKSDDDSKQEVFKSVDTPEESKPETDEPKPVEPKPEVDEPKPEVQEPRPAPDEPKPEAQVPETPQVQSPSMPSNPFANMAQPTTPSLDDIMRNVPQVPQQPQEEPKIEEPKPEEDKKIEDKIPEDPKPEDEAPDEPKPEDKAPDEPKPEAATPAPEDAPPAAPGDPKPAADAKPHQSTVVEVDGKPVDFKDPKIARMVEGILNGEDGSPVSLRNAAEAAGIKLPGEDQDIGKPADPNSMEPGTVIAGKDGNYVYIGDDQVLGEDKKIKPLSEVAVFDGEHDGIFTLDTGSPAPEVLPVADEKPLPPGEQPGAKPADSGPQAPGVTPPAAPSMPDQNGSPAGGNSSVFPTTPDKPIGLGGENNGSGESPDPVIVPTEPTPSADLPAPADPRLPLSTDAPINPDAINP